MWATVTVDQKWTDTFNGYTDILNPKGNGQLNRQKANTEDIQDHFGCLWKKWGEGRSDALEVFLKSKHLLFYAFYFSIWLRFLDFSLH